MIDFVIELDIARPPGEVFAYVVDATKLASWQTNTVSAVPDGPMGLGTQVREVHRAPGGKQIATVVETSRKHLGDRRLRPTQRGRRGPDVSARSLCLRSVGAPALALRREPRPFNLGAPGKIMRLPVAFHQRGDLVPDPVVLINIFEVPDSEAKEFVTAWERTRDYLRTLDGHLDTALHQATSSGADFQFVNIAHWRSAEAFTEAIQSDGFRASATGLRWRMHPPLYRIVSRG